MQQFEDALFDLIQKAMDDDQATRDEIISVLELKIMAMNEEADDQ